MFLALSFLNLGKRQRELKRDSKFLNALREMYKDDQAAIQRAHEHCDSYTALELTFQQADRAGNRCLQRDFQNGSDSMEVVQ